MKKRENPALWTIPVRCMDCRQVFMTTVKYGTCQPNFLCAVCDAHVSRWLAEQDQERGDVDRSMLVAAAREYLGVPFFWGGMTRQGMDCCGLLLACVQGLGWTDWTPRSYGRQVQPNALYAALTRFCDRVDTSAPMTLYNTEGAAMMEAGDLLLFAVGGQPQHLAIANGDGGMIHAHEAAGKVVEQPIDTGWMRRLVGVWRWRGGE